MNMDKKEGAKMFKPEDLSLLKKEASYVFKEFFEYIIGKTKSGDFITEKADMNVLVKWNEYNEGYDITYDVPDMDLIDSSLGNGTASDFYHADVEPIILSKLEDLGIGPEALSRGDGDF